MSSIIAMIYHNEICLASDKKSIDHETGHELDLSIKQIVLNDEIAIGFSVSGNIAQVIMSTLLNPINSHLISNFTFLDMPKVLDDIYNSHMTDAQYPDEEMRHISALIVGTDNQAQKIIHWRSNGSVDIIAQSSPNNFTAFVLPPYDITQKICNEILFGIANSGMQFNSISELAIDYFKVIASISKYVSESATIWTHTIIKPSIDS